MKPPPGKLIIGCGYLGRRVGAAWLRQGHAVTALTRSPETAEYFHEQGFEPVIGDVMDPPSLAALPDAGIVLYAVGYDGGTGHSQRELYVDGLENVLREIGGRVGRLLYVSSTSVYGQNHGEWVDESSPCEPVRPNGRACLEAEQVVWRYFPRNETAANAGASVLRLAGIYGPGRLLRRVEGLRSGQPLSGHPEAWLNLIHVDDAVQAVLACEDRGRPGATYLVCDDQPLRRREYYQLLASLVEAPAPTFADADGSAQEPQGLNKRCSNKKLHEELGLELLYPTLATGLLHALRDTDRL